MGDSISGLSGTGGGDMMRMLGMATGLDVDGMVKKMLVGEQKKVDQAKQKRDSIAWKQEMYRDIIKDVKDLQNTYFNVTSKDCLTFQKNYFDYKVTSTNSTVATATGGVGAIEGNYKINVASLAQVATIEGGSLFTQAKLSDFSAGGSITIGTSSGITIPSDGTAADGNKLASYINGEIAKLNLGDNAVSVSYIKEGTSGEGYIRFNGKEGTNIAIKDSLGANSFEGNIKSISTSTKLSDIDSTIAGDSLSFKIKYNGQESEIKLEKGSSSTIQDLISAINTNTNLKESVKASFDNTTGKMVINSSKTGSTENIEITDDGGFLGKLGLNTTSAQGQDALVTITKPDGSQVTMTQAKNDFTLNGVNYSLKGKGDSDLTLEKDVDSTFDRIVKFIDKYNSLIDKINTKVTERKDYSYKPLTEAQRKDMKEDEIKAWEEKAKKGALRNDDNLQNLLQALRGTFFEKVEGVEASFGQSIGLDTEGKYTKAGQIKFSDETGKKFKEMLKDKPEEIMNLFTKSYTLTEEDLKKSKEEQKKVLDKNSGIFQRVDNILRDYVGIPGTTLNTAVLTKYANKQEDYSVYGNTGSNTLPDQIYRQDNKVKELNKKMFERQEMLYKKFSRLEVAMNKYNSQASWLAQQFGGGQ